MPESVMSRLPMMLNNLESMKFSVETSEKMLASGIQYLSLGCDMIDSLKTMGMASMDQYFSGIGCEKHQPACRFVDIQQQSMKSCFDILKNLFLNNLQQLCREVIIQT